MDLDLNRIQSIWLAPSNLNSIQASLTIEDSDYHGVLDFECYKKKNAKKSVPFEEPSLEGGFMAMHRM